MKAKIIPIVIGTFGTATKELLMGLGDLEVGGRVEIIQTTTLLRSARVLRRVLETWEDMVSLRFQWTNIIWCWSTKNLEIIIIKSKFDHTNKWYMHNPTSVLENHTHKLLWDFDIQTDQLISARRPHLIIINNKKENLQNCGLYCPGWPQNKTERKWKEGWISGPC